ncbi:phage tail tube protein [Christensenellaceae bacterium OttesenSCG-928-L17]|nr:phage tail tube protein [Christensenellaceae bacterium OttesenSCG-928-L17]
MAGTRTMSSTLTLKQAGSETEDLVISSLTSIGEVTGEREEIDVTTLDSPNGAKEYISGAVDWGTREITGNVVDAEQVAKLRAVFDSQATREWEVGTPAGNKEAFSAFIGSFGYGEKTTDGLDTYTFTLRLSGAVEYTAA